MNNFTHYTSLLIALFLSTTVISQDLNPQWHALYGSTDDEYLQKAITIEDGFLLVGIQSYQVYLMKLDKDFNIKWEKKHEGFFIVDVKIQEDGYLIGLVNNDFEVLKVDKNGEEIWRKKYGGTADDNLNSISDYANGYLLVGSTRSQDGDVTDNVAEISAWVVHINKSGDLIWERSYETTIFKKCLVGDDYFLYLGYSGAIVKTDLTGNIILNKTFDDSRYRFRKEGGYIKTAAGDFIVSGEFIMTPDSKADAAIIKISEDGDLIWANSIGRPQLTDHIRELEETSDGTIIVMGTSLGDGTDPTAMIFYSEASSSGNILREEYLHGESFVTGVSILASETCPYLFAGSAGWFDVDNEIGGIDYGLFCFDDRVNPIYEASIGNNFSIYPNPSDGNFTIKFETEFTGQLNICNAIGQVVKNKYLLNSKTHALDLSMNSNGIYIAQIRSSSGLEHSRKISIVNN